MNPPEIAVVVGTRDQPDQVRRALLSVLACDYPALSVVVVDQSRGPDTMVALDRWADHRRVRILTDGRPGLARGRNRGIEAASADLVAFTDDDCVVARDWPAALAAAFDRCGPPLSCSGRSTYPHTIGARASSWIRAPAPHCERRLRSKTRLEGIGACMAVRRAAWRTLGGFDEMLGVGAPLRAGEDADRFVRALLAGYDVCEEPAAVVTHHGFRRWDESQRVVHDYMYGLGGVPEDAPTGAMGGDPTFHGAGRPLARRSTRGGPESRAAQAPASPRVSRGFSHRWPATARPRYGVFGARAGGASGLPQDRRIG